MHIAQIALRDFLSRRGHVCKIHASHCQALPQGEQSAGRCPGHPNAPHLTPNSAVQLQKRES